MSLSCEQKGKIEMQVKVLAYVQGEKKNHSNCCGYSVGKTNA